MSRPPNFTVWIILARRKKGEPFMPYGAIGLVAAYTSRKDADNAVRELRVTFGRGNCYVQMYGPIS